MITPDQKPEKAATDLIEAIKKIVEIIWQNPDQSVPKNPPPAAPEKK